MPQPASVHSRPLAGSGRKGMSSIDFSQVEDYCGKPAARNVFFSPFPPPEHISMSTFHLRILPSIAPFPNVCGPSLQSLNSPPPMWTLGGVPWYACSPIPPARLPEPQRFQQIISNSLPAAITCTGVIHLLKNLLQHIEVFSRTVRSQFHLKAIKSQWKTPTPY